MLGKTSGPSKFLTLNITGFFVNICLPPSSLSFHPAAWRADVAGARVIILAHKDQGFSLGIATRGVRGPRIPEAFADYITVLGERNALLLPLSLFCSPSNAAHMTSWLIPQRCLPCPTALPPSLMCTVLTSAGGSLPISSPSHRVASCTPAPGAVTGLR